MLVLSHRGLHGDLPENTLAAFEAAVRLGVDGIETDLRLSEGGEVVLHHDRNAPDGRPVSSLSRSELCQQLGYEVATLAEALRAFPGILWNLEIKDYRNVEAIADAIRPFVRTHRLLITSFWHPAVVRLRSISEVDGGVLVASRPHDGAQFLRSLKAAGLKTAVWHFEFTDPDLLKQANDMGLQNFVYGVETHEEHRTLTSLSLTGAITDHPGWLLRARP